MRSAAAGTTRLRVDNDRPRRCASAGVPDGWVDRPVELRANATDAASGHGGRTAPAARSPRSGSTAERRRRLAGDVGARATVIGSGVHTRRLLRTRRGRQRRRRRDRQRASATRRRRPRRCGSTASRRRSPSCRSTRPRRPGADRGARRRPALRARPGAAAGSGCAAPAPGALLRAAADDRRRAASCGPAGTRTTTRAASTSSGRPAATAPATRRSAPGGRTARRWSCRARSRRAPCWAPGSATTAAATRRSSPTDSGATYRGRLDARLRAPRWPALPVRIVERFAAGRGPPGAHARSSARGADGRFALRLAPGPSREVLAVFAGTRTPTRGRHAARAARGAQRRAACGPRHARPRSAAGRSSSAARSPAARRLPPDGLAVQLQFRLPGLPWTEFRTVQTDRRAASATPTASATTTAAACASASAPSSRRKATGRTSRGARGQSLCAAT